MFKLASRFMKGESGARVMEYGLIATGISVATIVTLSPFGDRETASHDSDTWWRTRFLASTFRSRSGQVGDVGSDAPGFVAVSIRQDRTWHPNSLANLKAPSGADRGPLIVKEQRPRRAGEVIATS
jgi:Flp pilus assembly pilin Flp